MYQPPGSIRQEKKSTTRPRANTATGRIAPGQSQAPVLLDFLPGYPSPAPLRRPQPSQRPRAQTFDKTRQGRIGPLESPGSSGSQRALDSVPGAMKRAKSGGVSRSRSGTATASDLAALSLDTRTGGETRKSSTDSSIRSPQDKKRMTFHLGGEGQSEAAGAARGSAATVSLPQRPRAPYGLIHTMGATPLNEQGGDGAYSAWMQSYFDSTQSGDRGVVIARIERDGPFIEGNEASQKAFEDAFLKKISEQIESQKFKNISTFIFNPHIRTTGRPNSHTGRGINNALLDKIRAKFQLHEKEVRIVYTVHEPRKLLKKLKSPDAVISLNPAVSVLMRTEYDEAEHFESRVPNLMTNRRAEIIDDVGLFLENRNMIEHSGEDKNFFLAQLQTWARQRGAPSDNSQLPSKAIVIFGTIVGRHGLNVETVTALARKMKSLLLDRKFKVVIAGSEQEKILAASLKYLAETNKRVHYLGPIEDLDTLSRYRYAISFDKDGYRANASAIVNLDRNGFLVYTRQSDESDDDLINRAVHSIKQSEHDRGHYIRVLAENQPRTRSASPSSVGAELGAFFARIAGP